MAVFLSLVLLLVAFFDQPLPQGATGEKAEELGRKVEQAVNRSAWDRTQILQWSFAGRHTHLWDRKRRLHRLERGDTRTLLKLDDLTGKAWRENKELKGEEAKKALNAAYSAFINDSFWLNPAVKIFEPGTSQSIVNLGDGEQALLVSYALGGETPGDSYLWKIGKDGVPRAWQMWVSILPVGGIEVSWEAWIELSTGARVSTIHRVGLFTLRLEDVAGAETLSELFTGDPFAKIFE